MSTVNWRLDWWFSTKKQRWFCCPWEIWNSLWRRFWLSQLWLVGIFLVSARDAVEHLAMHRTVPQQRMICLQRSIVPQLRRHKNINSAKWDVWSVSLWGPLCFGPCLPFRRCSYLGPSALAWSFALAITHHLRLPGMLLPHSMTCSLYNSRLFFREVLGIHSSRINSASSLY